MVPKLATVTLMAPSYWHYLKTANVVKNL